MYDEFKLSGAQRGYKQPGKKLLPRDSQVAAACDHMKCSKREYMRGVAAETAHHMEQYGGAEPHVRKYNRVLNGLSSRWRRMFDRRMQGREFPASNYPHEWPRPLRRAYDATVEYDQIERCIAADDAMWANAQ